MSSTSAQARRIGFTEFLVLTAAMMACQAFAVDGMLPALPTIAHALGLSNANRAQLIVTAYVAGLGCGQLVWGMLSDRYGRRPILSIGLAAYVIAALLCSSTRSFDALLGWRFLHGTAAASLVTTRSVIRDLYCGSADGARDVTDLHRVSDGAGGGAESRPAAAAARVLAVCCS